MFDMVDKYKYLVRKIIRQKTGGSNPDLEQEVFIRLWQKRHTYTEQGREKSWVSVITNNICIDYFKNKFYIQERRHVEIPNNLTDDRFNPESAYDTVWRQRVILRAVDRLPRKLRQVIILQEFEGMTLEQIAARLQIPIGTVKSRLFTARKILASELDFLRKNRTNMSDTSFNK